jgi:hypothetical protein
VVGWPNAGGRSESGATMSISIIVLIRGSDNSLAGRDLSWESAISLAAGMERTYRWVYDQLRTVGSRSVPA